MCNISTSQWNFRVGDRHAMPARSPSVGGIPSRATGFLWTMFATLRVSSAGHLGQNPYYPSPKAVNTLPYQIPTPLLLNIWSVASYHFVLKPLCLNSLLPQLWTLFRQHHSMQPIIDNPLLYQYFCYYLEWVYENEMFLLWRTRRGNQWLTFPQSDKRIRLVTILLGSQSQRTGLGYFGEVKSLSYVQLFATSWAVACQAPPSMEFSRQEYWNRLLFPSPGESSQPRNRTQLSYILGKLFTIWATREAWIALHHGIHSHPGWTKQQWVKIKIP